MVNRENVSDYMMEVYAGDSEKMEIREKLYQADEIAAGLIEMVDRIPDEESRNRILQMIESK